MPGQIFVPLGKRDRIEEIIPYLDVLARPPMQVVVLTPYREKVSWMKVQLTAMQTGTKAITTITALTANASREAHLRSVEERILQGRQALQKKGMTVVIHCYSGSLRNAITNLRDADHEMIAYPRGGPLRSQCDTFRMPKGHTSSDLKHSRQC